MLNGNRLWVIIILKLLDLDFEIFIINVFKKKMNDFFSEGKYMEKNQMEIDFRIKNNVMLKLRIKQMIIIVDQINQKRELSIWKVVSRKYLD